MDNSLLRPLLSHDEWDVLYSYNPDFDQPARFGTRLAVLAIDFNTTCVGIDAPIAVSIKRWPKSSGSVAWKALRNTSMIIEAARIAKVPIFYTVPVPLRSGSRVGFVPKTEEERVASSSIVAVISPKPEDHIIYKSYPSAFFGTNLMSQLAENQVNTLVVTGGTTSGCIRATVVDGCSYHFRIVVVEDAVYDRISVSHLVNLFEMRLKYADLASTQEVIQYLSAPGKVNRVPEERRKVT